MPDVRPTWTAIRAADVRRMRATRIAAHGDVPRGGAVVIAPRDTSGRFVRTPLVVWFETTYTHNGKRHVYRTREHTPTHARLCRDYQGRTVRCDKSIPWPFGTYAEVVS